MAFIWGKVDSTGISANIPTTIIVSASGAGPGTTMYTLIGELECTSAGAGTITLSHMWTDAVGSATATLGTLAMSATGRVSLDASMHTNTIYYLTSGYSSGRYALRLRAFT